MRSSTGIKKLAGLLMAGVFLTLSTAAFSESAVTEGSKAAGMDACVAPTEDMRRNHMDYLKHGRIKTVREGVRGLKYSLSDCVDCHAASDDQHQAIPVDAEGQFCSSCHEYVAVDLACFQCHRKTPEDKQSSAGGLMQNGFAAGKPLSLKADELGLLHALTLESDHE